MGKNTRSIKSFIDDDDDDDDNDNDNDNDLNDNDLLDDDTRQANDFFKLKITFSIFLDLKIKIYF